jgi:RHS repeat-associated protein
MRRTCSFILLVFVGGICFCGSRTCAQGFNPSQSTGLPNTVYSGSNIDKVDLISGNIKITIPLFRLQGRGIDTLVQLSYNSIIWGTFSSTDPNTGLTQWTAQSSANATALNPWNYGISGTVGTGWVAGIPQMGHFGNYSIDCTFMASGSCQTAIEYESWVKDDGTVVPLADDVGEENCRVTGCPASGAGLWSSSGDYTRFAGAAGIMPSALTTGRYKDGTTVSEVITGGSTYTFKIEDANGNFVNCVWNATPGTSKICTDTVGRTITFNYDSTTQHALQSITYKDSGGTLQTVSFTYQTGDMHYPLTWLSNGQVTTNSCPDEFDCFESLGNSLPLAKITLPSGLSYQFQYLPCPDGDGLSTGLITQISLPTGGYVKYTWSTPTYQGNNPVPLSRIVSSDGTTGTEKTWTYNTLGPGEGSQTVYPQVTDPNGNIQIMALPFPYLNPSAFTFKDASSHVLKTINRTTGFDASAYNDPNGYSNPRVLSETTILGDTNQQSEIAYTFGTRGNITEKDEYDWGPGAPGSLIRKTTSTYLNNYDSTYDSVSVHILDRIKTQNVCNSTASFCSQMSIAYDGTTLTSTSNIVGHDYSNYPSSFTKRGNPTLIQNWLATTSTWLSTSKTYNDVGNLLQTTDPNGNSTSYLYADNYYNYSPPEPTSAFPTQITRPATAGVNHIERFQFYFNSGMNAASCGENFPSATTCAFGLSLPLPDYATYTYDWGGRLLVASQGDGGQTAIAYNESSLPISVSSTTKIDATHNLGRTNVYDGLGRVKQSQLTSDPQGSVLTDTTYDPLGRVATVSNPYRSTGDSTYGVTTYSYDALGRTIQIIPPDGNTSSDNVSTSYSGNSTTVTDQAGKSRKNITDGLGRLAQVFEDPAGLNYETDYTYDALDNLLTVNQKGGSTNSAYWRTRTFTYDSLSRLVCASNPESSSAACPATATSTYTTGTTGYAYDADGDLSTKTAPAPNQTGTATVITSYSYDALNRLTQKNYNDSGFTPTIQYGYDAIALTGCSTAPPTLTDSNPKGRRTAVCDGAGAESWAHDVMGRVLTDSRTTNGVTKSTVYTYLPYVDGSINTVTYPSGRTLTFVTGAAERPLSAQDNSTSVYYASNALYAPQGALLSLTNGPDLYSTHIYNNRLQPCWLYTTTGTALATSTTCTGTATTGNIRDFKFNFNLGSSDNGNIAGITNNRDTTRSQAFSYDSLSRAAVGETTSTHATSPTNCWGESYFYDNLTTAGGAWGNLTTITSPSSAYTGCTSESLSVTALTTNRLSGYGYDAPGNLNSGSGVSGISYNAENQLVTAAGVTYKYDGDGKRVQKSGGTIYWYGTSSDALDETDLSGNFLNEYVFFGSQRIARRDASNNVFYYFTDHLGTSRTIAEVASGQSTATLCYDADFYPFGGERTPIVNTCSQNYKFTGKERDSESGLDNFETRYGASNIGRFMSPDPIGPGQHPENPQSWNTYAYVLNNPLKLVDPTGQFVCESKSVTDSQCDDFQRGLDKAQEAADKLGDTKGWDSKEYLDAQRAIDAYGDEGVDNGVTIAQGNVGSDMGAVLVSGSTVAKTADNPNGQNIRVVFDKASNFLGGDIKELAIEAAHEGVHVADGSDWVSSGFSANANPSIFQTEQDAYSVGNNVAYGLGAISINYTWGKKIYTIPLPLSQYGRDLTEVMIKRQYPLYNLDAFSRNTNMKRFQ